MAKGAAAAPTAAPAAASAPASPIPAKYQVKKDDGTVDTDASMAKWAEGHTNLEKRLGAGDAPPATPDDYAPTLPDGLTLDTLKADPLFKGFLKGAHARGVNNAQLSWVLAEYAQRQQMASSPEVGEAVLRKEWVTDDQMTRGLADCHRAVAAFAVDEGHLARLDAKFGNDPDFVRLMARIGPELREDTPVNGALSDVEQQSLESLMASKEYHDAKDPKHAETVARVQAMYRKRYPERA
jgi:hypothetical protein